MGINHKVLADRVERGYQFLREYGDALDLDLGQVDLDVLRMRDTHRCILGQANRASGWGSPYGQAMDRINGAGLRGKLREHKWATRHGFDACGADGDQSPDWVWDVLDTLWRERIARHREEVTAQ